MLAERSNLAPRDLKSTNVRSFAIRALGRVSSNLAARWLEHWFLTPPTPRKVPSRAREVFESGCPFTVTSDGAAIRGVFWGDGPSVYLLHGWGGRATQLASFVQPLVRAGFMPVAFDAPAHGASGGREASLLHFARALGKVAQRMGPARAVIAHSMGGAATAFAMRRGFDTERVVLIGAPADPSRYVADFLRGLETGAELAEAMKGSFARRYEFDWDEVPLVPARGLGVPALVIHDQDDREAPHSDAEAIAGTWPGAELMTTSGLGHYRILRDEAVIQRVVAWLAQTRSPLRRGALA